VLLPVILRAFVRASGASGGVVLEGGAEVDRTGRLSTEEDPVTIELGDPGSVVELHGLSAEGDPLSGTLMRSLAAQAQTALENAHLHRMVEQQASTDELTQLANRRRFMETLARELKRVRRFGGDLAVVLADLDDFKAINDQFGHQTGDEVLVAFADVMRAEVRDVDLPARLGGEEFAILLPETSLDGAASLAERIRAGLTEWKLPGRPERTLNVTASFGVSSRRTSDPDADLLLLSDAALYRAKRLGKNRVVAER
jgi:diguanylate cyclase (GGDEF)-like protein